MRVVIDVCSMFVSCGRRFEVTSVTFGVSVRGLLGRLIFMMQGERVGSSFCLGVGSRSFLDVRFVSELFARSGFRRVEIMEQFRWEF